MAGDAQFVLPQRQRLAGGHAQLPLHQIQPGDGLGDRVLHLQPGVHFHEVEAQVAVVHLFGDELHRAGAHITHRLGGRHRGGTHLGAALGAHARRGGFLQHLLVAALHRAITLEQVDHLALAVAEHLDFDVTRAQHIAFDQHMVAAEAVLGLALATGQRGGKVFGLVDAAHALAAAAGAGLDQHRVADARGLAGQQVGAVVVTVVAGHQRHAGGFHQRLGGRLAAHGGDGAGRRADEGDAGRRAGFGKSRVLRQETVTRMHRLGPGGLGCGQDAVGTQVAVFWRRAADGHRLVTGHHMVGIGIGGRIHRHGADAQPAAGGRHAAGDLTAVGNQDLLEHGLVSIKRPRACRPAGRAACAPAIAGT